MACFFIKASPLQALAATAAPTEGARCAARFNGCRQCRRPRSCNAAVLINTSNVEFDWRPVRTFYVQQ